MQIVDQQAALEQRLAEVLPDVRPPAVLLKRLAEVLAGEPVLLLCGDLAPQGFGAYGGQLCLVTPNRVLLVTGMRVQSPEQGFGLEVWDRQVGPVPHLTVVRPPAPRGDSDDL